MSEQQKLVFRNRVIDKGQLKKLISWSYVNYGTARTSQVADKLKNLGFRFATRAGVSISVDDLMVPPIKQQMLEEATEEIRITENRYTRGEITEVERFQKVIDTWNITSENLKDEVVRHFKATDVLNSVYMMAFSGARGNLSQVRQLVGMRGLMADPQGEIIDLPIKTNFREGLTVTEYIISSYGARKGLVDTALRTADSGYLTRRLVDVSQDVIVREIDCGTNRGIVIRPMMDGDRTLIPLRDRLMGRIVAQDVYHPRTKILLASRNQAIDDDLSQMLDKEGVPEVVVRSPLTCEAARSVCMQCYGWSLAHGKMVDMGEAVGIIAAQSIGEPGTQLTMRTFHTGGVFTGEVARQLKAAYPGTVRFPRDLRSRPFRTRHGEDALIAETNTEIILEPNNSSENAASFPVAQGSIILVHDNQIVKKEQILAEVPLASRGSRRSTERATKDVSSDLAGEVLFADVIPEERIDRQGNSTRIAQRGGLIWVLSGDVYNLPPGAEPVVTNGQRIEAGDVLAETKLITEHGGVVRLPQPEADGSTPREIEIITASVLLDEAVIQSRSYQGRDQYFIHTTNNQTFSLKATPGTKVQNNQVVAELIDDTYRTNTGGIIKYAGVEVAKKSKAKQGYEVIQGGTLLWIPEESHEVNKDISLLMVEDGQYVEAGTEVVKDIFCQNHGVVEITQKNDILREIVIKPGDLHIVDNPEEAIAKDGGLAPAGSEVLPGIEPVTELRYIEYVETPEGPALLLRPVKEFAVPTEPPVPSQESINEAGRSIRLRAVQRIPYKDGERVKSVEGLELLRTQLILEIDKDAPQLAADIELVPDNTDKTIFRLQLVILESLIIRRDMGADPLQGNMQSRLLVSDGEKIAPGAVVSRTEIGCKEAGIVRGIKEGGEAVRRILIVRETDLVTIECPNTPSVKIGDLLVSATEIAPGMLSPESGKVEKISNPGAINQLVANLNQYWESGWDTIRNNLSLPPAIDKLLPVTTTLNSAEIHEKLKEQEEVITAQIKDKYGEYGSFYFQMKVKEYQEKELSATEIQTLEEAVLNLPQVAKEYIDKAIKFFQDMQKQIDWCDGYKVQLRIGRPYRVSSGAILHVEDGGLVQRGDNLVLLVFERAKTGDIIQGLPRIEELLEARKPKEASVLAKRPGTAQVIYADDDTVEIKVIESDGAIADYSIGLGQSAIVSDGQAVETGTPLTDGPANPHEILEIFFDYNRTVMGVYEAALDSFQRVQTFLVNEVQSVYQSQGIDISDKHIEVIVRQMTSKVRIDDGGDTTMLPGELVELRQIEQVNEAMSITGMAPASYTPVLLGITKASLNTDSFISAASFQETTRVLTEAAIEGKSDWLRGLKENVIIGRLIPAGTGFNAYKDGVAVDGDAAIDSAMFEEDDELKDVVLDDLSARSYGGSFGEGAVGDDDSLDDEDDLRGSVSGVVDDGEMSEDDFDDDFDDDEGDDDF